MTHFQGKRHVFRNHCLQTQARDSSKQPLSCSCRFVQTHLPFPDCKMNAEKVSKESDVLARKGSWGREKRNLIQSLSKYPSPHQEPDQEKLFSFTLDKCIELQTSLEGCKLDSDLNSARGAFFLFGFTSLEMKFSWTNSTAGNATVFTTCNCGQRCS